MEYEGEQYHIIIEFIVEKLSLKINVKKIFLKCSIPTIIEEQAFEKGLH